MGSTASVYMNRITLCLSAPQDEFVTIGMRRLGLGKSEYVRRLLDRGIEITQKEQSLEWLGR